MFLETSDLAEGSQVYRTWKNPKLTEGSSKGLVILTCKDYEPYHYRVQKYKYWGPQTKKKQQKHYSTGSEGGPAYNARLSWFLNCSEG